MPRRIRLSYFSLTQDQLSILSLYGFRLVCFFAGLILIISLFGCGLSDLKDVTQGWSAQRLYSEAKSSMNDKNWDKAIEYLEKLEARYPYGRFAQQAQMDIAYAYFKSDEPASAIVACDRFIKLHPNHPHVDYIYYLKGLTNFNEDQGVLGHLSQQDLSERDPKAARDSFESFKELVTRFPNSKYAPDALARMTYLMNALAQHEIHVARYYMKRGAYLAASNRAQDVVKDFPEAPAKEEALFIMSQAYDKLGLFELRDDVDRVIKLNYPDSVFFKGGLENTDPWWKLFW